ncbi:hypothetical protein [Pseudovibrio sp. JE062]|uniref:hypothetical protein n=1 Tax=Pseudovibrio sp. JE062 TaxID=439495 RepID=UPI000186B7A4|nr:hypothetical protein [Pseudovibrio sp. JE062]EEA96562.1 hypothetical protein PJE062_1400 [Pseudovibrio sp. JE062]
MELNIDYIHEQVQRHYSSNNCFAKLSWPYHGFYLVIRGGNSTPSANLAPLSAMTGIRMVTLDTSPDGVLRPNIFSISCQTEEDACKYICESERETYVKSYCNSAFFFNIQSQLIIKSNESVTYQFQKHLVRNMGFPEFQFIREQRQLTDSSGFYPEELIALGLMSRFYWNCTTERLSGLIPERTIPPAQGISPKRLKNLAKDQSILDRVITNFKKARFLNSNNGAFMSGWLTEQSFTTRPRPIEIPA